jgi:hypothetical protein
MGREGAAATVCFDLCSSESPLLVSGPPAVVDLASVAWCEEQGQTRRAFGGLLLLSSCRSRPLRLLRLSLAYRVDSPADE